MIQVVKITVFRFLDSRRALLLSWGFNRRGVAWGGFCFAPFLISNLIILDSVDSSVGRALAIITAVMGWNSIQS